MTVARLVRHVRNRFSSDPPPPPIPSHEFIDHTGEAHLRVRAASLGDLLAEAGRALAEMQLGPAPYRVVGEPDRIVVRSSDREALVIDWLNELIFFAETRHAVPVEFEVRDATERRVVARVRSAPVAETPSLIKAATLHGLAVRKVAGGYEADVVLDI